MRSLIALLIVTSFAGVGCASYVTPGRGADLRAIAPEAGPGGSGGPTTDPIAQAFNRQPTAKFPAGVAVARVQAAGYTSPTAKGWGNGRYSLVTTRDIEKPEQLDAVKSWPQLHGFAPLNRLLINDPLDSDQPLRQAAASLHADMLLIYTLDTTFKTEDKAVPLSVVTLGLSPNQQVRLTTTASAVLLDTRTGFVYGVAEATAQQNRMTNAWQDAEATDTTRRATETEAFGKLMTELGTTWAGVVKTYAAK